MMDDIHMVYCLTELFWIRTVMVLYVYRSCNLIHHEICWYLYTSTSLISLNMPFWVPPQEGSIIVTLGYDSYGHP